MHFTFFTSFIREWQVVALVTECAPDGTATLTLRNKFREGDTLEAVGPDLKPFAFQAEAIEDGEGLPVTEPKTPRMVLRMKLPQQVPAWSILRIERDLSAKS